MPRVKKMPDIGSAYDVTVIGGGLGGLTAANRLARFGRRVLLVERHSVPGGLAAFFRRKGHIFDVSLHGFPYGMVKTCRKYWSREIADRIVQLKRIVFDNPEFRLETTFDTQDFTRILIEKFGIARRTVDDFFATVGKMDFFDDRSMTTRELFERFFPGRRDVVRFLMEPIAYANGSTLDEPAITYGIVFSNFMNRGVFTFEGGTDRLIDAMLAELEANKADVLVNTPVDGIVVRDGRVAGVEIGGRRITTDCVVSNANLKRTVLELIPRGSLPGDFVGAAERLRLSTSSCQVYIGIRADAVIPEIGDLLFTSISPHFDTEELLSPSMPSKTFSVYYPKTRPGHARSTVVASMNARYEDWAGLSKDEYAARKRAMIDATLDALEKYIPGVGGMVDYVEAATPLTFERYTGHIGGASFGTKFEGLDISGNLPKVLPGMFHTGSAAIIMSGWLGAANYGVIVANRAEEYLERRG